MAKEAKKIGLGKRGPIAGARYRFATASGKS
jgi:hypothetical protein